MFERVIPILILMFFISSCGGAAPAATEPPAPNEPANTSAPADTEPPAFQSLEAPTRTPSPEQPSSTPPPTATQIVATPTDTPLPTLELPTEIVNAPVRMVWDGAPTYPAESRPGFVFRVTYDPELWALTSDQFGFPALGHRLIPGCVISVTSGRGLPLSMTVEHEMLDTGQVTFDVGNVFENGLLKFVTYTGGNATIITAFQVNFEEQSEGCQADAVTVLSTLTSVPASQATPTPAP